MNKLAVLIIVLSMSLLPGCNKSNEQIAEKKVEKPVSETVVSIPQPKYLGRQACEACHKEQFSAWQGSHHDLAMQPASEEAVLGNFNNVTFSYAKTKTTFYREKDQFKVRTDGSDGQLHDYVIKYAFGVEPLQQYLIELDDGRVQALGIAWDSRDKQHGGQRWFHLYPDQQVDHNHELHWTGRQQNWNFMCAECHSTRLRKNYNAESKTFATTFSEINVSCEACHGPGSNHIAWANGTLARTKGKDNKGLRVIFDERKGVIWKLDAESGNTKRSKKRQSEKEIDTCARCHSRRSQLSENFIHGRPIGNTHRVALLDENLYFSDGQPNDETYVYGSFLQSKMYHKGVTCSDCHDPHRLELRAEKDQVCYQCHQTDKYASTRHHFHPEKSAGASCIECHMPVTTFMVVDPRHDHSFRLPRPDLSLELGTPNACNLCHRDKPTEWAVAVISEQYGRNPKSFQQYAKLIYAARRGDPAVRSELIRFIKDPSQAAIARATAVSLLPHYMSREVMELISTLTQDREPLVRRAVVEVVGPFEAAVRLQWLSPLLTDNIKEVRIDAARALADIDTDQLPLEVQSFLQIALQEYIASQQLNADRPEALMNLGSLYMAQQIPDAAESAFKQALALDPDFVPAVVNLADLYRAMGRDREGETMLREQLQKQANNPAINHALGLLLVRQKQNSEAIKYLRRAANHAAGNVRYRYVYAVALHGTGEPIEAINILEQVLNEHPFERDSLWAIYTFYKERGDKDKVKIYRQRLEAIDAENPQLVN